MSRPCFVFRAVLLAACVLLPIPPLQAGIALPPLILTVGNTGNCDHGTIQAAIDAAPDSGNTVIRISNNVGHTNQALSIVDKNIELRGGYPGCDLAPGDPDDRTTIRGNGGDSVVFVDAVGDPRTVVLRNLVIREGGSSDVLTEFGGGVRIQGLAQVEVRNSQIGDNESHNGGGIGITSGDAGLLLDDGTIIGAAGSMPGNRAVDNGPVQARGGGISCHLATVELRDARIRTNTSDGDGGGLYAQTCHVIIEPSADYVMGNSGADGFVTFFENHADINGGAIRADEGLVFWRSGDTERRFAGRVVGNTAGNAGGALYLTGSAMQFAADWVRFESNHASNTGGAIYLADDARFFLRGSGAELCTYATCAAIVGSNFDQPANFNAAGGAIYAVDGAEAALSQALLADNVGAAGSALLFSGEGSRLTLRHVLVHRNFLSIDNSLDSPIDLLDGADGTLIHVTMSANLRADPDTLLAPVASSLLVSGATSLATLANSIFTDDGLVTVRTFNDATATGSCLLSHESASVSGITIGDPDYVAPFADPPDFTPGSESPALDRCATAETFPMVPLPDFTGRERPVWFHPVIASAGPYDIGAIERPRDRLFSDGFEIVPIF